MNARYALLIPAIALLAGCGAHDLTNDQAKALLNDYYEKKAVTQPLLTGMDNIGKMSDAEYFATPGGKYQKLLEADGLIIITSKGKIVNPANRKEWFNALDIKLTDKGRKFVSGPPNTTPAPSSNTWPTVYETVVFCGREINDITSLNQADDSAHVDFLWHAAKMTPFAAHFHEADPNEKTTCNESLKKDAVASFERRDGKWLVSSAE